MAELLNNNVLAEIIAAAPVRDGHSGLLSVLHSRYPETQFRLIAERDGCSWGAGIMDQDGKRITDRLGKWVDQELAAANGSAREVWNRHKLSSLIRTERVGSVLHLTAPFGSDPDAFYQLEVLLGPEVATSRLFDPKATLPPEDRFDLLSGPCMVFGESERQILAPARYQFEELVNVKRFLRELVEVDKTNRLAELPDKEQKIIHVTRTSSCTKIDQGVWEIDRDEEFIPFLEMFPHWKDRLPAEYRIFLDWKESSAGREGRRFCDHWWVQTNDWTNPEGKRRLSFIPQWADADGGIALPKITPDWDDSPFGVMESLLQFDSQVGYSFAWYFYMLHGNRIEYSAGSVMAKAIEAGKLRLGDPGDEAVLLRWHGQQYVF